MLYFQAMQKYELTIVLDGKATAAKKKTVTSSIEKAVELLKGKLGTVIDWGVKDLSYKIQKSTSGTFIHIPLEIDPLEVKKLVEKIKTDDVIIRYLLVKV
jgi:ribosomal protein S6